MGGGRGGVRVEEGGEGEGGKEGKREVVRVERKERGERTWETKGRKQCQQPVVRVSNW